jgi:hypothetical protein
MSISPYRLRTTLGALLATSFIAAAPASAMALNAHRSTHRVHHRPAPKRPSNRIPQHNAGDRDSDNNGAPSDGDGDV